MTGISSSKERVRKMGRCSKQREEHIYVQRASGVIGPTKSSYRKEVRI